MCVCENLHEPEVGLLCICAYFQAKLHFAYGLWLRVLNKMYEHMNQQKNLIRARNSGI